MKLVIVGAGDVGNHLCRLMSEKGHDVTIIESCGKKALHLDEELNVRVIEGNGSSAACLVEAEAGKCDFFMALTSDDRVNLIACSVAKALGAKVAFARLHDQTYADNSIISYQEHFQIDHLLNPEGLCAVELAKPIRHPGRVAVEKFARGQIEVQQTRVDRESRFIGKPLRDLRITHMARIGFLQRGNEMIVPTADTVLERGDLVTLFGKPEGVVELKNKLQHENQSDALKILIFGGGEIAIALMRLLTNSRFKLRVIEPDAAVCRSLADRFPTATIIHGDCKSRRLLEEEHISDVDYYCACTKDDEDNIVTGLQAGKMGARNVMIVFNKPDYDQILSELIPKSSHVTKVISPSIATSNEILRYLRKGSSFVLAELPNRSAQIVEFKVSEKSPAAGSSVKDLRLPQGNILVALQHQHNAVVPGAEDVINAGDRVVLITRDRQLDSLNKLFIGG